MSTEWINKEGYSQASKVFFTYDKYAQLPYGEVLGPLVVLLA